MRQPDDPDAPPFSLKAAIAAQLSAADAAINDADSGSGVHEARIALKRMRALARLAERITHGSGRPLNLAARAAMEVLADARDLLSLETAARQAKLPTVADNLHLARDGADAAALTQTRDVLSAIGLIVSQFEDAPPEAVTAAAKRMEKRARKTFADAKNTRKAELRHTWRKREKDRQNLELLLDGAWPNRSRRRRAVSRKLTSALGEERDATLLIARLKQEPALAGGPSEAEAAIHVLKKRRRKFAKKADRLGRKLHHR